MRGSSSYPHDHNLALARALRVVDIIAGQPDITNDEVVAQLCANGIDCVDAELLVAFVPTALAYPLLKQLGVASFQLAYVVPTRAGKVVNLSLGREHYFTATMRWAEQIFALGPEARPISLDVFWAVAGRSAAMDAANQILRSEGEDALRGSVVGPLVVSTVTLEQITVSRPRGRPWWLFWD